MGKILNVGIVGSGGIATEHAEAWNLIGVNLLLHSVAEDAKLFARQYNIKLVPELDDLLSQIDIVDVCTPTDTHHQIVLQAAAAGVHVVCEKPLARTLRNAIEMEQACQQNQVALYPAHVVRYFDEYHKGRQAVEDGILGHPSIVRLSRRGAKPVKTWFSNHSRSGGVVLDQMIHDFDYARWIAGEVDRVYAKRIDGPDGTATAYAILTHETGALSHITGKWGHRHTRFSTAYSISGTAGKIIHSSDEQQALSWDLPPTTETGGELLPTTNTKHSPFYHELKDFSTSILSGDQPRVTAADGIAALEIALAANESIELGQPITLERQA